MIEDGVNGILVPAADPAAIAVALQRLIDDADLRRRLSDAGRRTVEQRFDARGSDRAVQAVVETALAGR
jgi:glycosyltransferase involved in cell wall biosynthesis